MVEMTLKRKLALFPKRKFSFPHSNSSTKRIRTNNKGKIIPKNKEQAMATRKCHFVTASSKEQLPPRPTATSLHFAMYLYRIWECSRIFTFWVLNSFAEIGSTLIKGRKSILTPYFSEISKYGDFSVVGRGWETSIFLIFNDLKSKILQSNLFRQAFLQMQ